MRRRSFLALAGGSTLGLAACSETAASGEGAFRVVAFTAGYGTPVGKSTMDSFVEQGKALGWDVKFYTSAFDYEKTNQDVQNGITQGADVVLAGFPDPRQISPIVRAAQDADIPIFSIDGGVEPNPDFVQDVTAKQQQIADLTVEALGEAMGGLSGKNVMIVGHDPHIGIMTRSNMAKDLFEAAGATIVGGGIKQVQNPGTSHEESLKFVTDYLQANPDALDGVWCGWDDAAVGVTQAIDEAGRTDIFVTGCDAVGVALAAIKENGPFYATVIQPWPEILTTSIDALKAYAADGTLPTENFVESDVTLVDRENVDSIEPTD